MPTKDRHALTASAAALALFAGVAVAAAPDNTPADKPASDVLGGPEVKDNAAPGAEQTFDGRQRKGEFSRVSLRDLGGEIRKLARPGAPEELRLTPEQSENARAIFREHAQAMRAFATEHREQIDKLRAEAGLPANDARQGRRGRGADTDGTARTRGGARDAATGRRDTDAPARTPDSDSMDQMNAPERARPRTDRNAERPEPTPPTPEQKAAREELAKLMAKGPQTADAAKKVMALLTEPQRAAVKAGMEKAQKQRADRMQQRTRDGIDATTGQEGERARPGRARGQRARPAAPATNDNEI